MQNLLKKVYLKNNNLVNICYKQFAKKKGGAAGGSAQGNNANQPKLQFGKTGTTLKMGIVGMANVGKSTTFNLLSNQSVPAENFPFCTIDPNSAIIQIPDERFEKLCELYQPDSEVCATIQITDIAGLVKGASEGEGLGNEFLSHIKQVDGIFQVVRAFEKDNILHTEGFMDPVRDLEIIKNELIAKDLQFLEGSIKEVQKKADRSKNPDLVQQANAMKKAQQLLREKKWLRFQDWENKEVEALNKYHLLSTKPVTFLVNQSQTDYEEKNCKFDNEIKDWVKQFSGEESQIIKYSAEHEFELQLMEEESDKLKEIILNGYKLLNLIHFFTTGKDEVRCWTVKRGSLAPQAASVIHTDFEKGFVSADVLSYDDFNSVSMDKIKKLVRKEGKDYEVKDGDIIHFKCKIGK